MIIKQWSEFVKDFKVYGQYRNKKILALLNINLYINLNYRISNIFYILRIFILAKFFWLINRILFSVDIDPGAKLSGGFLIVHGIGLVIGRNVETMGAVKVYHGVTLGGNNSKEKEVLINGISRKINQPIIYPNVTIGINSSVLGPVIIKENVIIGTGAIVTKDVPRDSLCKGINIIQKL